MSDWAPGDLALCVDVGPETVSVLTIGRIYSVTGVGIGTLLNGEAALGLRLAEVANRPDRPKGFHARLFRKIRPDEHESCEPEFIELLKRSKRRVDA